jgi:probable rRNA maturation factor
MSDDRQVNSGHKARTTLSLSISAIAGQAYVPFVRKGILAAHGLMKTAVRELSVALVGDVRMSRLHERFMGIAGPTDVLTFELDHDARGRVTSGEVVICVGEARRRAGTDRSAVERELLLYALHGLLHLSGFDDRNKAEYSKMHDMEDRILTRLGVGRVFAPSAGPAPQQRRKAGAD